MKKNKFIFTLFILTFLIILVLFPSVCFSGAKTGLLLWFETVLPVLFPFFIVTYLMNYFKITDCINMVAHPLLKRIFKVPPGGSFPILLGFLSGFPIGAKACADEIKAGKIDREQGQYILSFCNNVSPAFLSGYISLKILGGRGLWPLIIVDLAALLCAVTYRLCFFKNRGNTAEDFSKSEIFQNEAAPITLPRFIKAFDDALISSVEILIKIGGYIIIFSVIQKIILSFALKYTQHSGICLLLVMSSAFMEVTSGSLALSEYLTKYPLSLPFLSPVSIKTALVLMTASFGGISAIAQTKSVIMDSGLSLKKYFLTRIINAVYAALLSILLLYFGIF